MSNKHKTETETGEITGTMDKDYNLLRYIENCLENAWRIENYRRNAERENDSALAALFTMAQEDNRKGAEIGKKLLASRLVELAPLPDSMQAAAASAQAGKASADVMAPSPSPSASHER